MLHKRRLGVRKKTDNDQVQRIIRNKENFILKGVIHLRKKMTSESEIGFHYRFKCDTSIYKDLCDARMKSWNSG